MKVLTILNRVLRASLLKVLLVILVLMGEQHVLSLNTNVTYNGTVCAGGVLTLSTVLASTNPAIPAGHRNIGVWKAITPINLSFSSLTDPNAIVSGMVFGSNTVTWTHKTGQVYTITFNVQNLPLPNATLEADGAKALILCSNEVVDYVTLPAGLIDYKFYLTSSTGVQTVINNGNDNSYSTNGSYFPTKDVVFSVVTAANGCQNKSDVVVVSNTVTLEIQGGTSACDPSVIGKVLQVVPYQDPPFTYTWNTPSGVVANVSSVTITAAGNYSVTAVKGPPNACTVSSPVTTVSTTTSITKPIVTGASLICATGASTVALTSNNIDNNTNIYWYQDGTLAATGSNTSGGVSSSILSASQPGSYLLTLKERNNELCYISSDPHLLSPIVVDEAITVTQNCNIPTINYSFSGNGTSPYTVTFSSPVIGPFSAVNGATTVLGPLAANTTFTVSSVRDASGCYTDGTNLPRSYNLVYSPIPNVYTVTGANVCNPTGLTIGLSNSENGVIYKLYRVGNPVALETITSTGTGAFNFTVTPNTVGSYKVTANRPSCTTETDMSGTLQVFAQPSSFIMSGPAGSLCSSTTSTFGLSGSTSGVTYRLVRVGTPDVTAATQVGTGGALVFPAQSAAGTYKVTADNGSCTPLDMVGSFIINQAPTQYNITGNGVVGATGCVSSGLNISLDGNELGVFYALYRDGNLIASQTGNSNFGFRNVAGVYTIVGTLNGCTTNMNSQIAIYSQPLNQSFVTTGYACPTGVVALTGSELNVSYQVYYQANALAVPTPIPGTMNGTGAPITLGGFSTAGIYSVVATNISGGCTTTLIDRLTVQASPALQTLTVNKTPALYCSTAGLSGIHLSINTALNVKYQLYRNGVVQGSFISGTGGAISWNDVTAGDYTVQAYNDGGCNVNMTGTIQVLSSVPPTATISVQAPNSKCAGGPETFTLNVALTGTAPFNFKIVDGVGNIIQNIVGGVSAVHSAVVSPVSTTTYRVIDLVDAVSCTPVAGLGIASVTVNPIPVITVSSIPNGFQTCSGSPITVTADGAGVGGVYEWSLGAAAIGNSASITVSPSVNTTYQVKVTTAQGCFASSNVPIIVNPLPIVDFTAPNYVYCQNDPNVSLAGNPAGGSYTGVGIIAAGSNVFSPALANPGNSAPVNTPITYTLTDGNGCTNSITKNIVVNPVPTLNINGLGGTYCANAGVINFNVSPALNPNPTGFITVDGQPAGRNVWWFDDNDGTGRLDVGAALANVGPGTYDFRYTYTTPGANGCTSTLVRQITIRPDFNANLAMWGLPINPCQTDNTPYLITATLGGVAVTNGVVFSGLGITSVGVAPNVQWYFTPSTAGNGTHTINLNYTDPVSFCSGGTSGSVTVGTNLTITGLQTIYCKTDPAFILVGDVGGVTPGRGEIKLYQGPIAGPAILIGTDADDGDGLGEITFDPASLANGDYYVQYSYTANFGLPTQCVNVRTFPIQLVATPDATFATSTGDTQFCESVTSVLLVPNVTLGSFSGPGVSGTNFNPQAAGPGAHTITHTVTTSTCTKTSTIVLSVVALPNWDINNINDLTNLVSPYYCDNDPISTIQSSNFGTPGLVNPTFTWTNNSIGVGIIQVDNGDGSAIIQPQVAGYGNYQVWFTDEHPTSGCVNTVVKNVEVRKSDPVNIGGFNPLAKYCKGDAIFTITASFVAGGLPVGSGGTYTASDAADLPWLVDNGDGTATINPTNASVGPHSVIFTYVNSNGCTTSVSKIFTILDNPTVFNVSGGGNRCSVSPVGLTVNLSGSQIFAAGTAEYEYRLYLNGTATTRVENGTGGIITFGDGVPATDSPLLTAGAYTVWATNLTTGCSTLMSGTANILVNAPDITWVRTPVSCRGGSDGTFVLTVTPPATGFGDTPPYDFSIDNGTTWSNSNTFTGLAAANYQLTVRDALGCSLSAPKNVSITQPAAILGVTLGSITNVGCTPCTMGGTCEGATSVTITGGTKFPISATYPFQYDIKWYDATSTLLAGFNNKTSITGLLPGNYSVVVTDQRGCQITTPFTIGVKTPLSLIIDPDLSKHIDNNCAGGFNGQFAVIASGGSGTYQYSIDGANWLPAAGTALTTYTFVGLDGTPTGKSYTAYVRDFVTKRCLVTAPSTLIFSPAPLTLSGVKTDITCYNASNGMITLTATGGKSGTYNYKLDAVSAYQGVANVYSGLAPGTYNIAVQDAVYTTCPPAYLTTPITLTNPINITAVASVTKNVKCFGGSDGELTVSSPNGGTAPYSYRWYSTAAPLVTVGNTQTVSSLPAGTYQVEITDAKLCSFISNTVVVAEPTAIVTSFTAINSAACNLVTEGGSATLTISGGTAPYTQVWSSIPAQTTLTAINLPANTYNVTVTDNSGCTSSNSVVIGSLAPNVVVEDATQHVNVDCNGVASGSFTVVGSGGSGDYDFSIDNKVTWQPGDATDRYVYSNKVAGSYTVYVRDRNHPNCQEVIVNPIVLSQPAALGLSVTTNIPATCNGTSDGVISVVGSGGSGNYDYSLDGGAYSAVNNWTTVSVGTHTVWVRDANSTSCEYKGMAGVVVTQPAGISFTTTKSDATCNGSVDGSITVTVSAGSGTGSSVWAYSIDNGVTYQASNLFSGLAANTYQVRVRDVSSPSLCQSVSQNVTIAAPAAISATENVAAHVNVACFGASTGSFQVVPVPLTASLSYSIDGGVSWSTNPTFSNLAAGTYQVSVRNSVAPLCTQMNVLSVTITQPAATLAITNPVITDVLCPGAATGAIQVTVVGGGLPYTYTWRNSVGNIIGGNNNNPTLLVADTYTLTVVDANLCQATGSYVVIQPVALTLSGVKTDNSCYNSNDGTLVFTASGGISGSYEYSINGGTTWQASNTFVGLGASSYTGMVRDVVYPACSPVVASSLTILNPTQISATVSVTSHVSCNGGSDGVVTVTLPTGGNGGYAYNWFNTVAPLVSVGNTQTVSGLPSGTYQVTITDSKACTFTSNSIFVSQPVVALDFNFINTQDASCNLPTEGGQSTIQIVGGTAPYSQAWSTLPIQTGITATNLAAGIYSVTVTDSKGCTVTKSVTINTLPALVVSEDVTAGQHVDVNCFGSATGSFTVQGVGGSGDYDFSIDNKVTWQPGDVTDRYVYSNKVAGSYTVYVRDRNHPNCQEVIVNPIILSQPAALGLSVTTNIPATCNGTSDGVISVVGSGGSGNYDYSLDGGAYSAVNNWTTVSVGTHTVWVRDANSISCEYKGMAGVVVTQPAGISFTTTKSDATCNGSVDGSITVTVSAGSGTGSSVWAYSIDNGVTYQASNLFSGLAANTYQVRVRDVSSPSLCQSVSQDVTIAAPAAISATENVAAHVNVACFGASTGSFQVVPVPLTASLSYSIDGGVSWSTNPTFSNLAAGTYQVSVRNSVAPLCTQMNVLSVTITQPAATLAITNPVITDVACYNASTGAIQITVTGGTAPCSYTWRNSVNTPVGGNNNNPTLLPADTYSVTVRDANLCSVTGSYTITQPVNWNVSYTTQNITTFGGSDGRAEITTIVGAPGPYTIDWSDGLSQNSTLRTNLPAGNHWFRITSANGCIYTQNFTLTQPLQLVYTSTPTHVQCYNGSNGHIDVAITSGTTPYTISYTATLTHGGTTSFGPITQAVPFIQLSGLAAGVYTITVKDASNQSSNQVVTINEPLEFNIQTGTINNISCTGVSDGQVQISIGGARPAATTDAYQMSWVGPKGYVRTGTVSATRTQSGLAESGTYVATVTDPVGCIQTTSYTITKPAFWNISTGAPVNVTSNGGSDGQFSLLSIAGSVPPYQIRWYDASNVLDPSGNDLMTRVNLRAGYQHVTVNGSTGCDTTIYFTLTQPGPLSVNVAQTNVTCYDGTNGTITINITSGNPNYTYHIVGNLVHGGSYAPVDVVKASGTQLYSGLKAGVYDINVTDQAGQNYTYQVTLTEPLQFTAVANNGVTKDITCNGQGDGAVGIAIVSTIPAATTDTYNLTWSGPGGFVRNGTVAAQRTQNALTQPGTYTATASDLNGCSVTPVQVTIAEPAAWSVSHVVTNVSTYGGNDGAINVNSVAGNTSPYTISWADAPSTNFLRSGLVANSAVLPQYTYTILDSKGCNYSNSVVVTQPAQLVVTLTPKAVTCYAGQDGSIKVEITNGNTPYTLTYSGTLWDGTTLNPVTVPNVPVNYMINSLKDGTYVVDVVDAVGNTFHQILTGVVAQPANLLMSAAITDISCYGSNNGQVAVSLSGRPAAQYNTYRTEWIGPNGFYVSPTNTFATAGTQSALQHPGNYQVNIWDTNNCLFTNTYPVQEPNQLVVNTVSKKDVTCFGGNDGAISISVTGRPAGTLYTYAWTRNGLPFGNTPNLTGLTAGDYQVIVTAPDNCTGTSAIFTVTESASLSESTITTNVTTCNTDNSGAFRVTISGGKAPYKLDYGNSSDVKMGNGPFDITGLIAGTYTFTITDASGCQLVVNKTITAPAPLVVSSVAVNTPCASPGIGTLTFSVTGGYAVAGNNRYNISIKSVDGGYALSQVQTIVAGATFNGNYSSLPVGNYSLEVIDINATPSLINCPVFTTNFVVENITINGTVTNATCAGVNSGKILNVNILGESPTATYAWSTLDGVGLDLATLNQNGLSKGTYTLTVTDPGRGGCIVSRPFVVDVDKVLSIDATVTGLRCYNTVDGSITNVNLVNGAPVVTYAWTGPGINAVNINASSLTGLINGTYQLTATGSDGCATTRSFDVPVPAAINYQLATTLDNCSPYSRSISMSGLTGGNGLLANYRYSWNGPISGLPTTANLSGLNVGGTYTVTVTDENVCQVSKPITITGPMKVVETISHLDCNGATNGAIAIALTGGKGPFVYSWTGPSGFTASTKDISNLIAGNYTLTITDQGEIDVNTPANCLFVQTFNVTQPDAIVVTASQQNVYCAGDLLGELHLNVVGGTAPYSYVWSSANGAGLVQGSKDQTTLKGGTYSVVITDAVGCSKSSSYTLTEPVPLSFTLTKTDTQCDGTNGSFVISAQSGGIQTPVSRTYTWAGPSITAANQGFPTASNIGSGIYTVTMTDLSSGGRACAISKTDTLTSAISLSYTSVNETCEGEFNGSIDLTATGGSGSYTFLWTASNGGVVSTPTTQDLGGLPAGTYTVVVTDTKASRSSCTKSISVVISRNYLIDVTSQIKNIKCLNDNDGAIDLSIAGGSGNYTYSWSGPAGFTATTQDISSRIAGDYTVTVNDMTYGCAVIKTYKILSPSLVLNISSVTTTDVLCNPSATGAITITHNNGGTGPYTSQWAGPGALVQNSLIQTNLIAGIYQVTVKDAQGCTDVENNIVIHQPLDPLKVSVTDTVNVAAYGGSDGEITVNVVGGANGYNLAWTGVDYNNATVNHPPLIDNISHQTSLSAGRYNVVVTDGNGCTDNATNIPVRQPGGPLSLFVTTKDVLPCHSDATGEFNATVLGGMPPYTINWYRNAVYQGFTGDEGEAFLNKSGLTPASYKIEVIDKNGITKDTTVNITEPPQLVVSALVTANVNCYQASTGSLRINVSGGKPNLTNNYRLQILGPNYAVSRTDILPNINYNFTALATGNYHIVVTDNSNGDGVFDINTDCYFEQDLLITEPKADVVISQDSEICKGELSQIKLVTSNWSNIALSPLTVTLSDGTTHTVNSSPFLIDVNPLATTTYTITSVHVSGCAKGVFSGQAVVKVNELPTAYIHNNREICLGESAEILVDLTGEAPYTFTYGDGVNVTTISNIATSPYKITVTPTVTTSYTLLSVSDANCATSLSANIWGTSTITVNSLPTATISGNNSICEGNSTNLAITFNTGVSPWTVKYTVNGAEESRTSGVASLIISVSPAVTTTYQLVSVTDSKGCEQLISGQQVIVTVSKLPLATGVITGNAIVCQSQSGVAYSVDPVGNSTNYNWTVPSGASIVSGNGTNSILVNFSATTANGYVSVQSQNSCGTSNSKLLVTVDPLPVAPAIPVGPTASCQGSKGLVYTVTPIIGATGYKWNLPAGYNIVGDPTGYTITVDLDPSVGVMTGDISVQAINDCGVGLPSGNLQVQITPYPTAFAGNDEQICNSSVTLKATNPGAGYSGQWTILSGSGVIGAGDFINPAATVTNLMQGENKFVWKVTNTASGCTVTDTVSIFNNQLIVNASTDLHTTCDGSITVKGTDLPDGTTGHWSFVPGFGSGTLVSGTNPLTDVTNLSVGVSRLQWTITKNSCASSAVVEIVNDKPTIAVIVETFRDACLADAILTANIVAVGESGVWTLPVGSGNILSPNSAITNVTNLSRGENIFHYTITKNSCSSKDSITVRNNILDVNAGDDQTSCNGTAFISAGSAAPTGSTGYWTVKTGNATFSNNTNYNTMVENLDPNLNVLVWNLNKNGCVSSDSIRITNNQPSNATVGSVISVCGDTAVLNAVKPAAGTLGQWQVFNGAGVFDNIFDEHTVVRGINKGDNTMRWLVTKGACTDFADLTVKNLKVDVSAGLDSSICERATYLHGSPIPAGATGEWTIAEGSATFVSRFVPNARIGGLNYGNNAFAWNITSNNCISSDTVRITVNAPVPPNAGVDFGALSSNATLNATEPTAPDEVAHWILVAGGAHITNPYDAHSTITDLRRGANVFRWIVEKNDCSVYDEVTITNGQTIDAEAGPDQEVCNGEAVLRGNDPDVGLGEWSVFRGSGKIGSPSKQVTNVTELGPGSNVFKWTIYYTNTSTSDTVTIVNSESSAANAGNDRVVCGSDFTLEGSNPSVGDETWYVISGQGRFDDPNLYNTAVHDLSQGINVLKYEIKNRGCTSVDTVKLTNNLPTKAIAGTDEVLCIDSLELRPNTPTYGIAEWRVLQGTAFFEGNYATKLGPGLNILEYSIRNGTCISSDTINITNSTPSKAHAGNDRNICVDTATLSANIPQYYTSYGWELLTGAGNIAPADISNPYAVVRDLGSGRNRFRWVINNGTCQSVDDVEIANNFIQANAGLGNTICTDTLILEANNPSPGFGSWGLVGGSGSAQFENAGVPNTVVRNLDQGSNLITWTILNVGCKSVSTIDVVNDTPTAAYAGANKAICDSSIALSGNTPSVGSATWSVVSGSGNFVSPVSPTTTVNGLAFGKNLFRWSIVNNACTSYDDVEIAYNTVYATVGDNQVLCGNTTSLEASSATPGLGTWSIVGGTSQAAFANINDPNTTVSNLGRGKNILRWSITNQGCTTTDDVEVTNDLPSDAYAGNNQEICIYNTTLDATAVSIGTGSWHVLTGAGVVTAINDPKSAITSLSQGDNVLQWRVVNNLCTLTDEVLIKNNIPSQPYAGSDFESCNNTINLKAAPPAYGAGTWSIVSGAGNIRFINQPETEVTNLKADINVFKWEVVRGNCRLQDSITITNNTPTKANAGPDIHDCKDNAILDGNIATNGTGLWSIVTGSAEFDEPTDPKTKVTGLGFGDNSVQWTISKGSCFTSDIVMVFNKVPDQSKAGVDQVVCENYTTLNANDPTSGTGTWVVMSGLGEFEDRNNYQSKVNNIGFGENVYKWTIQYGSCSTFDLVAIRSNKAYADAGADDVTYTGSYELAANKEDNTPGAWEVLAGQGIFVDANNFNTVVSGLRSGVNTFRWKIIVDNCEAFDDVSVNYKVVPDADFIASTNDGCSPLTVKFTNYTVGRDSTFYWEFDDGVTSTLRHPTHTFQVPGVYTVTLTARGPDGNDATSTMLITVRPHPVADFSATPEVVYVPGDQVRFYNFSVDAVAYKWYFGHDNDASVERNPIYEYPETGIYSVALTVENIYHCTDSVYKADYITARQQGFIIFPNAFTPRGDANVTGGISSTDKNAIFRPVYKYVDVYEIQIFNQWGQMIYSSNNIDEGWNGEFNGQVVPQGVYVWKVTGKFLSGKGFNDVGNVMVVR